MSGIRLERSTKLRLVFGFAVLPPSLALLSCFVFLVLEGAGALPDSGRLTNSTGAAVGVGLVVGILAFLVTVGGAVPVVLSRSEHGPLEKRWLLTLGAALGNVPLAVIMVSATLINLVVGTLERGRELYEIGPTLIRVVIGPQRACPARRS